MKVHGREKLVTPSTGSTSPTSEKSVNLCGLIWTRLVQKNYGREKSPGFARPWPRACQITNNVLLIFNKLMSVIDNIVFVNPPTNGQWIVPIGSCRLDLAYWSVPIPLAHKTTLTILPSWHILTPSPNPFTAGVWRILAPPHP